MHTERTLARNTTSAVGALALLTLALGAAGCTVESTNPGPGTSSGSTSSGSGASSSGASSSGASGTTSSSGSTSSGSSGNASCVSIAGTWHVQGACGEDTCVVTQDGCATKFKCGVDGAVGYTGSVKGTDVEYSGTTAAGIPGSCTGTANAAGTSFSGTCRAGGETCQTIATNAK